jgi:hypothetical protein
MDFTKLMNAQLAIMKALYDAAQADDRRQARRYGRRHTARR